MVLNLIRALLKKLTLKSKRFIKNNGCYISWNYKRVAARTKWSSSYIFYVVTQNLRFTTTEEWKDFTREPENADDADTQNHGEPRRVIISPDNRKFGLSPIPDKVYRVYFFAYNLPTELSAHGDEIVFPNIYKPVLVARARYYIHQFKEGAQAAAFALEDYRRGLKLMKGNLMTPVPDYIKDDRMRFV
jgi:hypothetical protein